MDQDPTARRHAMPCEPVYVFYDGHCASCHRAVRFLLQRSRCARFRFVALQSLQGEPLEQRIAKDLRKDLSSSLIVWKNGALLSQAEGVFAILSELGWPWLFLLFFRLVPLRISNFFYDVFAQNRYRLFGKARNPDLCALLPVAQRRLFSPAFPRHLPIFSPRPRVFLSAQWRRLILINYAVPAECLLPYVPAGVELDTWQGETLVSLVGFAFMGTSLLSMTLPICSDFEEVNLRFYVKRRMPLPGEANWQRGVVFIKEIVPYSIIAQTANIFYGERYEAMSMDHETRVTGALQKITYSWTDAEGECRLSAEVQGPAEPLAEGSLAEFITEHYFGYAKKGEDRTTEYEVEHPRWQVWNKVKAQVEGNYQRFYPPAITQHMTQAHSALLAEGSAVRVMQGQIIPVRS